MYQVHSQVWNEIARQPLVSELGNRLFHLPETEMDRELEKLSAELKAQGMPPEVRASYVSVAPLLAESQAIAVFTRDHPEYLAALPNVEDVGEAVILASMDRELSEQQQAQLAGLLQSLT